MTTDEVKQRILARLPSATVEVSDPRGSSDYFAVVVKSADFAGSSRLERHRMVQDLFKAELDSGEVHALTIKTEIEE